MKINISFNTEEISPKKGLTLKNEQILHVVGSLKMRAAKSLHSTAFLSDFEHFSQCEISFALAQSSLGTRVE